MRLGARFFIKHGTRPGVGIEVRRRRMQAYERWVPRPPAGVETVARPLGGVPASRVQTSQCVGGRHILFLHGGAYATGSPLLYRHITWRFAMAAEANLAAIDYRLAPEHPFPAALDDAAAAWRGLLDEGADPRDCAVVGDSAGGGLSLALALRLRDVSPLYGDPRGLPPTLLQVGSDEILRDDAERMAERMRQAGCEVTLEIWSRMPHVWHGFAPVLPEARRAITRIGEFIRQRTVSKRDR